MSAVGDGLGRVFNVIHEASGLTIPLTNYGAVSFVSFLDAGTHTLAFEEEDSRAINSIQDLAVTSGFRGHIGPGVGGTWTALASGDFTGNDVDGGTASNDCYVVTVRADQLSDGYDSVQCTASAGTCIAILHDPKVSRKPANLRSSLSA